GKSDLDAALPFLHRASGLRDGAFADSDDRRSDRAAIAANLGISGNRAADGQHQGDVSGRLRRSHRGNGGRPDRAGGERRRRHALYQLPIDRRWAALHQCRVQARREYRSGPGSSPESSCRRSTAVTGRGHAIWHHCTQIVARPHDGRAHDVAGWLAGSAIYRKLRVALHQRRPPPHRGRWRRLGLWRSRLFNEGLAVLRAANFQVAAGAINQPPAKSPGAFQLAVQTLGRLSDPRQFENIMIRADADGGYVRLRDIARVELGSQDYTLNSYLNDNVATAL